MPNCIEARHIRAIRDHGDKGGMGGDGQRSTHNKGGFKQHVFDLYVYGGFMGGFAFVGAFFFGGNLEEF